MVTIGPTSFMMEAQRADLMAFHDDQRLQIEPEILPKNKVSYGNNHVLNPYNQGFPHSSLLSEA